jgi:HK97 family phage prohead protease
MHDIFAAPAELKFVGEPDAGEIEGYGSVFGLKDWHKDVVDPGAFDETLAEHKANGTMPAMYAQHSAFLGGDPYPVGVWTHIEPDQKGLRCKGQLIALDHPDVSRVRQLVLKGAMRGLSIAFNAKPNGAVYGKREGEPRRTLKAVDLHAIDLVTNPSNSAARIESIKAMLNMPNHQAAAEALLQAHATCQDCLKGGDAPTADERRTIFQHIAAAYKHITGQDMPTSAKSKPSTIREFEDTLREWGFSTSEARVIAERGFKSSSTRDEEGATKEALSEMAGVLSGFSLKFGDE